MLPLLTETHLISETAPTLWFPPKMHPKAARSQGCNTGSPYACQESSHLSHIIQKARIPGTILTTRPKAHPYKNFVKNKQKTKLIFLKIIIREAHHIHGEKGETERSPIQYLTPQMATMAGADLI